MPHETEQDVLNALQTMAFGPAGPGRGCDQVQWDVQAYSNASTESLTIHRAGESREVDGEAEFSDAIERLKVATYVKGRGAWFSLRLILDAQSGPSAAYDLVDDRPEPTRTVFGVFPDAREVRDELWKYPRYLENIPQWALDRLTADGEDPMYLDPATDELVYRTARDPYRPPGTPASRPAPPATVMVAELGATDVRPGRDVDAAGPVVAALQRYARACHDLVGVDQIVLRPPAKPEAFEIWRDSLGVDVPPDLAELYTYANGEPEDFHTFSMGLFWLESAQQMAGVSQGVEQRFEAMTRGNVVEPLEHDKRLQPVQYHRGWLPFGTIDGNMLIAVDTVPTEHGRMGQVVAAGHHLIAPRVLASSLADYLDEQTDLVATGRCWISDSEGNYYRPHDNRPSDLRYTVVPDDKIAIPPDVSRHGRIPAEEQIQAILSSNTWRWAVARLSGDQTLDNYRFRDFISVTEDEVYEFVLAHGFDDRVVLEIERGDPDGRLCISSEPSDGRWAVFYTERGRRSREVIVPSLPDARREVVQRLMVDARISLNHGFKLAHPGLSLPKPSEMD